jgi:transposase-like protein
MSKRKGLRECPVCGSKNLQVEGHSSKGRQILHCEECDEVFEIHLGGDKHERERERERDR